MDANPQFFLIFESEVAPAKGQKYSGCHIDHVHANNLWQFRNKTRWPTHEQGQSLHMVRFTVTICSDHCINLQLPSSSKVFHFSLNANKSFNVIFFAKDGHVSLFLITCRSSTETFSDNFEGESKKTYSRTHSSVTSRSKRGFQEVRWLFEPCFCNYMYVHST